MKPKFILQTDDTAVIETRNVRQAAMLNDYDVGTSKLESTDTFSIEWVPVGSVEFVQMFARRHGVELGAIDCYPDCLHAYRHRNIYQTKLVYVTDNDVFVKPALNVKLFTGCMRNEVPQDVSLDTVVWVSEPVFFINEWRYYVVNGEIVGAGRYDDNEEDYPEPELSVVREAVAKMPKGSYGIDFGVLLTGETALIEVNDGWALGYYRGTCSPKAYALLLTTRWYELMNIEK